MRASAVQCAELEEAHATIASLRRLLAQSDLAFFEMDAAGFVTSWNSAATEVLGQHEQDAVGQTLEDLVGAKSRPQVASALSRAQRQGGEQAGIGTLRLSGVQRPGGAEVHFRTSAFYSPSGHFLGAAALAQLDAASANKSQRAALPSPVGGVTAWRWQTTGSGRPLFELATESVLANGVSAVDDDHLREMVEKNVRANVRMSRDGRPTPFECTAVPFETNAGGTQYFSIRGIATNGPEMPFGGVIGLAEGYVIDITALQQERQEATKWHDRWRTLAQLAFDFVMLVDITEYRVIASWGDTEVLGDHLDGRHLFEYMTRDDRASTIDAFSIALVATGGTYIQPLTFKHRKDDSKRIYAQCAMVSDPGDPSVLFIGAEISPGPAGAAGSASSSDLVNGRLAKLSLIQASIQQGQGPKQGLPPKNGGGGGIRLTAAALGLASGGPPLRPGQTPGLGGAQAAPRKGEPPRPNQASQAAGAGAAAGTTKPPAPSSPMKRSQGASGGGGGGGKPQVSRSRASSTSSKASAKVPRVLPTQIVLKGDSGEELWRSAELLLGENMRTAELLTRDSAHRFSMPQEFADMLQASTHELFVLDAVTTELLQIANLASTSLQSLQRYAGNTGRLTIVIAPVEDSEDAFETVPAPAKAS